ncbi:hypothetical protein IIV6-T1_014 [Invertebrate iridescent virus 6]|nr:hypothetical protein IIV6-T1_014 [Invertebrate iridescent virus 6]
MGIKYFFKWLKTNHSESIKCIDRHDNSQCIDVLLIDMNGIIHNSAQEVYGYGSFSFPKENACDKKVYSLVCRQIDRMVIQFKPKELILCIDGVAPRSKQIQQRQRRFLAAHDRKKPGTEFNFDCNKGNTSKFDSNSISPGTEFMHNLGRYIDIHIKKKQKPAFTGRETTDAPQNNWRNKEQSWRQKVDDTAEWSNLTVVFANDKVSGEGEHKLLDYIRKYGNSYYTYCIYGSDADLIMLSMSALTTTAIKNIYVLRDEYKSPNYLLINIPNFVKNLIKDVKSNWTDKLDEKRFINDFIFMCFMVGNDFLPHIPSIEIMTNGIESMLAFYTKNKNYITDNNGLGEIFNYESLLPILKDLEGLEQSLCNEKVNNSEYFRDDLLESSSFLVTNEFGQQKCVNINEYREKYMKKHFESSSEASLMYLEGMQWVLSYYTLKVPDWEWSYKYDYAPNLTSIIEAMSFKQIGGTSKKEKNQYKLFPVNSVNSTEVATSSSGFQKSFSMVFQNSLQNTKDWRDKKTKTSSDAIPPFHQLLFILPPDSSDLLPYPLCEALTNELKIYAPKELIIDRAGKRQEWEGIVLLPKLDQKVVTECYLKYKPYVTEKKDLIRDIKGRTFKYQNGEVSFL